MKKTIKYISYLCLPILFLFTTDVFAGVFDPPPSDKSIEFLGMIFGSNVGTIYLGGSPNPVISAMFEKLNIIVVALGTLVVSYIGLVSTINTAQEGQTMGRKWSSIWLPMRSMIGMLLMVPAPGSGFSMIQVTVLWAIMQGIGAADQVWDMVLDYLSKGISSTSSLTIGAGEQDKLEQDGAKMANSLLNAAICLESIKNISSGNALDDNGTTVAPGAFTSKYGPIIRLYQTTPTMSPSNPTNYVEYKAMLNIGAKKPNEPDSLKSTYSQMCGSYEVKGSVGFGDPNDVNNNSNPNNELSALGLSGTALIIEAEKRAETAMYQKLLALNTIFNLLRPVAKKIVDYDVSPRDGNRLAKTKPSPAGYMVTAKDAYRDIMKSLVKPTKANSTVQDAVDKGKRGGWIVAGSFYFVLNSAMQQTLLPTAKVPPKIEPFSTSVDSSIPLCTKNVCQPDNTNFYTQAASDSLAAVKDYLDISERSYIARRLLDGDVYETYDNDTEGLGNSIDLSAAGGNASKLLIPLQSLNGKAIQWLSELMEGDAGDPILAMASFGSRLMIAAESTWFVIIFIAITLSLVASPMSCASPGFMMAVATLLSIIPVVIVFMGILWTCGATMAVYIPLVPYMIYTLSVLGWFLLVIEAIIAAPIVSLGFVIPSGEELGKVVPGLMLLISIVLRPVLMIFGFILAARLFKAIVTLVNLGMADTYNSIPISGSLFSPVAAMVLYHGFIIALVNKCFALIYIVPDKVLRWIGGPTEQTDTSAMNEAKQGFEKGTKMTSDTVGKGVAGNMAEGKQKSMEKGSGKQLQSSADPSGLSNKAESAAKGGAGSGKGGAASPPDPGGLAGGITGGNASPPSPGGSGGPPGLGKSK